VSNRQKRKRRRMNQSSMQSVRDFVVKTMSISPVIADCIMKKCGISNPNEALLHYACEPYPVFSAARNKEKKADDAHSESEEEEEEEEEEEAVQQDAMYANMSNDEKMNAMKLNDGKFKRLMDCFVEFECLQQSVEANVCRGYILSKRIALLPMKQIHIFVKKKRSKQSKPSINLEDDSNDTATESKRERKEQADAEAERERDSKQQVKFVYDEFVPYAVDGAETENDEQTQIESFATFNECVDEFYSSHEAMKSEQKQSRQEMQALKKLETAKGQHHDRVSELTQHMQVHELFASIIEENLDLVDKAINGVNILLKQGIDWNDLGQRIREEAQYGNPVASIIVALKLHQAVITLKLKHVTHVEVPADADADIDDADDADEEEEESDVSDMFDDADQAKQKAATTTTRRTRMESKVEYHKIDVELGLSAWNNARKYYFLKKQILEKKEKTLEATNKALKAAELKAKVAMKEAKQQQQIAKLRRTYWFEKFYWFISSDNLLVIAGRDAQQNELIVKKYMDKEHDIYVHAQITGASSVVIKNSLRLKQIPPRTIEEAGQFCVCRSRAWKNNVSIQSYWVYAHQVSKTPPTGQFLPTGSFILRGKRNFITQQPLLMGVTLLFRIDHNSKQRNHENERQINYYQHTADGDAANDVIQQFIAKDIEGVAAAEEMKKRAHNTQNQEESIFITKTLVQSNPKARKEFEEKQKQELKTRSKTDKKLAKYGFTKKDKVLSKREKNKRKKRSKYHQMYDEKDRKLVQQLLGIEPQRKPANTQQEEEEEEEEEEEPADGYELNANPTVSTKESETKQENENENVEQEQQEEPEEDEYDRQRRYALCNNLNEELSLLTGRVHETDVVLYCMVMCAPYSAIRNNEEYEYKIKIQSGGSKRGKAVKHVYDLFENQIKAAAVNEKLDLLSIYKAVKETEINHIFLSDVKLSAPGLKTLQLQHKQTQKQRQKEQWKSQQLKQNKPKQDNSAINPKKRKKKNK